MTLVQIFYLFVGARIDTPRQLQDSGQDVVQGLGPVIPVWNGEWQVLPIFFFVINCVDTKMIQKDNGTVELLMYRRRPKPTSS